MSSQGEAMTPEVVVVSIMASIIKAADMLVTVISTEGGDRRFWSDQYVADRAWDLFRVVKNS